jgi:DNA excision repair protein ERCC-2
MGHDGFDFAYRFPGFTRVLQTVGRLIRDEEDEGIVLLVDTRFRQSVYRQLYPPHWKLRWPEGTATLNDEIAEFWSKR